MQQEKNAGNVQNKRGQRKGKKKKKYKRGNYTISKQRKHKKKKGKRKIKQWRLHNSTQKGTTFGEWVVYFSFILFYDKVTKHERLRIIL